MRRGSNFLIAAAAAALTFGALTLTLGPRHMERWDGYHHGYRAHFNGGGHSCSSEKDTNGSEEDISAPKESQQ
jgi:hypothetical protein